MHLREGEFEKAHTDFFEAFKNYDESGSPRRTTCLKYLVLANMLMKSGINPFDSQEVINSLNFKSFFLSFFFFFCFIVYVFCVFLNSFLHIFPPLKAKPYKNDPEILAMTNLVR